MLKTEQHLFHPRLRLLVLTILMVVIIAACGSRRDHTKLPVGYVDGPPLSGQAVLRGATTFAGWALADDGIEEVAVYMDRQYVASARTGLERPDVARSLPKEPNAGKAGWQASVDVSNLPPGLHEFVVQATAQSGSKRDIGAFQATIVK
jgi:hypothetical protein